MPDITRSDVAIIADHILLFGQVRLSHQKMLALLHQAAAYTTLRSTMEQISEGGRSNADFAKWAARVLSDEKADRPRTKRRSKPLVRLEAVS